MVAESGRLRASVAGHLFFDADWRGRLPDGVLMTRVLPLIARVLPLMTHVLPLMTHADWRGRLRGGVQGQVQWGQRGHQGEQYTSSTYVAQ